jgi:hypothetical protein
MRTVLAGNRKVIPAQAEVSLALPGEGKIGAPASAGMTQEFK